MARFSKERRLQLEARLPDLVETQSLQHTRVAVILGVSEDWVQRACKRLGLITQKTGPRPSGQRQPILRGGYRYIYQPDHPYATKAGYMLEHRLVMEEKTGRHLLPGQVVHHVNGDSLDNRPKNLMVFESNADHLRHELTGKCPKWTPEGRDRMIAGTRQAAMRRR